MEHNDRLIGTRQEGAPDLLDQLYTYALYVTGREDRAGALLGECCEGWGRRTEEGGALAGPELFRRMGELISRAAESPEEPLQGGGEIGGVLGALPEGSRKILILRDVLGLTYDQVALVLSCDHAAVPLRLHEARRRMIALLHTQQEPAPPEPEHVPQDACTGT